jgi:hypothetical protein
VKVTFQITKHLYDFSVVAMFFNEGEDRPALVANVGLESYNIERLDSTVKQLEKVGTVEFLS